MEGRIKVLHILHEIYPSGAEMMIYNAYPYWKQECDCTIMATGRGCGPFSENMEERGYSFVHVPTRGVGRTAKIKHLREFFNYMKSHQYDVVHIHRESLSFEYAWISKKTGSGHILRTVHSTFAHKGIQKTLKSATRSLMRRRLKVSFVAISDGVAANECKVFGNSCEDVIYNWCNNKKFRFIPAEEKVAAKQAAGLADKLVIVTVGNCGDVKNHMLLIQAMGRMEQKEEIHYCHVGYAPQETAKEKAFAEELGIGELVEFVGSTDPMPYLIQADLYVMTSRYEGLSVAALEAIFTGMHVLLAQVPGLTEFKDKGLCNVDYFSYTPEALAEKLDNGIREMKAGKLFPDAKQSSRAEELYDIETQVHKYVDVYQRLSKQ